MTVNDLEIGGNATIIGFKDEKLGLMLSEMGFILNEQIELTSIAPFGDPICIRSDETLLSIRRSEALQILIEPIQ